jgi:hypothetical protein
MMSLLSLSYKTHNDYINLNDEDEAQFGNRIFTVFLYLSDVEEGGQTFFPALNLTVHPKVGRVVMWPNVLSDIPTEIEDLTKHESLSVVRGEKYGANVWFTLKPSTTAYQQFTCDDDVDDDEGHEEEQRTSQDLADDQRDVMSNPRSKHGYDNTAGSEL